MIVNCIKPEKNIYDNTMEDFAKVDNSLASSQIAIGESSNLAQIALTYTYNFADKKYEDYVCILSVVAQIAIDNAKRKFDIDLPDEIARIRDDLDIKNNGLPYFWEITKRDKMKARTESERRERDNKNRAKIKKLVNPALRCPMNYIFSIQPRKFHSSDKTIGMEEFWVKHELKDDRRKSKQVEKLIEKYSFDLYKFYTLNDEPSKEDFLIMLDEFDALIKEIKEIYISKNYLGLMSWLINRAFFISSAAKGSKDVTKSNLRRNRPILLKVLYTINPDLFLKCFKKCVQ